MGGTENRVEDIFEKLMSTKLNGQWLWKMAVKTEGGTDRQDKDCEDWETVVCCCNSGSVSSCICAHFRMCDTSSESRVNLDPG